MSYFTRSSSIINSKLASQSVDQPNIVQRNLGGSGGNIAVSSSCGNYSTGSGSYVTVTNLSITLGIYCNAVMVMLVSDSSGNPAVFGNTVSTAQVRILNTTNSHTVGEYVNDSTGIRGFMFSGLDTSTIGAPANYNYQVQVLSGGGSTQLEWYKVLAYELA